VAVNDAKLPLPDQIVYERAIRSRIEEVGVIEEVVAFEAQLSLNPFIQNHPLGFVDALERRIASFDRRAIAAAKNLVNHVSLPPADRLLDAITSFETALTWPEAQQRIQAVLERGLQRDSDFENRWPEVLGTLVET
jgi:hypothetical protein